MRDAHGMDGQQVLDPVRVIIVARVLHPFPSLSGKAVAALPLPLRKASGFPRLALHLLEALPRPAVDEAEPQIKKKSVGKP